MKRVTLGFLLFVLTGLLTATYFRGGSVRVVLPNGDPAEGAEVWVSYVSGPAVLEDVSNANGRASISAQRVKQGGWHSIIASWEDPGGARYVGEVSGHSPRFPITITLSKR